MSEADLIQDGAALKGQLSGGYDKDYYKLDLSSSGTISVDFVGDGTNYYTHDVSILDASGNVLSKENVRNMSPNPIIFACANPDPEITPEEIEELESKVTVKLRTLKQLGEDSSNIDEMLASKGELISHKDDGGELSASDADIRGRLYEITGEDGIMPGDEVHVGMNIADGSLAGNEIEEAQSDFTFEDDEPIAKLETQDELTPQRQKPKRRQKKTAECGACGAEIPIMAKECPVCGAEFE